MWENSRSGPGQNRSSSARSWLTIAVRVGDEILPRAGQRPDRLRLIAVGLEHPEAVMIGPRELTQHERVKPIGLPARDPEPIPRGRDLVRVQRQHRSPASKSRSTSSPSGRSIATSTTSKRTSIRHSALSPFSSCA